MNKPHVHAAVIKAWADGKQIQYRHNTTVWLDLSLCGAGITPAWHPSYEYRVKPETSRYRVALFTGTCGSYTNSADDSAHEFDYEMNNEFVRWLTDWIDVEA